MNTLILLLTLAHAVTVERLDPRLDEVFARNVEVRVVARNLHWAEGPLYLPDGRLLFADIKANRICELDRAGRVKSLLQPSGYQGKSRYPGPEPGSSAMALDHQGRVVTAGHAGREVYRFDHPGAPRAGDVARTTLVNSFEGKRLNGPNDLVVAKDGSIYFTDPPFGLPSQKLADPAHELDFAGLYRLTDPGTPGQRLRLVSGELKGPNGLALAPDGRTLYVADTPRKRWVKFRVNEDGTAEGPETFARADQDPRPGEPDGLKVDRRGHVFAVGPGGLWVLAADGTHLGTVPMPKRSSNLAWGGPDRRTLFVTADDVIYAVEVKTGG